jgi:hypothetical protein
MTRKGRKPTRVSSTGRTQREIENRRDEEYRKAFISSATPVDLVRSGFARPVVRKKYKPPTLKDKAYMLKNWLLGKNKPPTPVNARAPLGSPAIHPIYVGRNGIPREHNGTPITSMKGLITRVSRLSGRKPATRKHGNKYLKKLKNYGERLNRIDEERKFKIANSRVVNNDINESVHAYEIAEPVSFMPGVTPSYPERVRPPPVLYPRRGDAVNANWAEYKSQSLFREPLAFTEQRSNVEERDRVQREREERYNQQRRELDNKLWAQERRRARDRETMERRLRSNFSRPLVVL